MPISKGISWDNLDIVEGKKYLLTEKECLKIGGHCYAVSPLVMTSDPPIYERICKHCGHTQHGLEQPSMNWHDFD